MTGPTIGVLALQGDVREHLQALRGAGRGQPSQCDVRPSWTVCDALVLPGGESTTMAKLARTFELFEPLRDRIKRRAAGLRHLRRA